jgi:uncharacterized membrane protein YbhN (UPF0104 family)
MVNRRRVLRVAGGLLALALFLLAVWVLRNQLSGITRAQILHEVRSLPVSRIWASFALMALGYLALGASDLLALRYLHRSLSLSKVVLTSFISYAFANSLPLSFMVGGWVRYRFYSQWKRAAGTVRQVVGFTVLTYALGLTTAVAVVFTLQPTTVPQLLNLPIASTRPAGIAALVVTVGYLLWSAQGGTLRVLKWKAVPPPLPTSLLQIAVSLADWVLSAATLYVLLPTAAHVTFLGFFGLFLLGQLAALVAQVPGGLGVFEAVMVATLRHSIPVPALFGALVAYRVIYFLVPLVLAMILLATSEVVRWFR